MGRRGGRKASVSASPTVFLPKRVRFEDDEKVVLWPCPPVASEESHREADELRLQACTSAFPTLPTAEFFVTFEDGDGSELGCGTTKLNNAALIVINLEPKLGV